MDSGSIAWMLMASALVLLMTPGLAFFYGGLVRGKNVISTVIKGAIERNEKIDRVEKDWNNNKGRSVI